MTVDGFVILTPILMLGVMMLLGFVGCDRVFGLHRVPPQPGPTSVTAVPGDMRVDLAWDLYNNASQYTISRHADGEAYAVLKFMLPTETSYTDTDVVNGTLYFYKITAKVGATETEPAVEVSATPMAVPGLTRFVTQVNLGGTSNIVNGFGGMAVRIGANPVSVKALGRAYAPGNSGVHTVKIIDGATSTDIPNASVAVAMTPATPGTFHYSLLPSPVTLMPGQLYYIVSQEMAGGDAFHRNDTTIATTAVAAVEGPVANQNNGPYTAQALPGRTFGPVDFQY
jgi:hypothetical protein